MSEVAWIAWLQVLGILGLLGLLGMSIRLLKMAWAYRRGDIGARYKEIGQPSGFKGYLRYVWLGLKIAWYK